MPLPSEIQIVPLDFDTIRVDLTRFLKNQPLLKDYNFEGSALATLIDVLAYDAYYHGWYTNFAVNEVFLQTAQLRNSVVSAARQLGYIPRSVSSAVAEVDLNITGLDANEGTVELPRYTPFTSTTSAGTFTYYNIDARSLDAAQLTSVTFPNVELYEGVKITQTFDIDSTNFSESGTRLVLPNDAIDTRTITVSVQTSAESTTSTTYQKVSSLVPVTATSTVFFLFENNDGVYEIQFGDDRIGRNLRIGQRVIVEYLVSRGKDGNGASSFSFAGSLGDLVGVTTGVQISVALSNANLPAAGGAARETIDSIKKNAPNLYQVQNRVVTPGDARTILLTEYSGIDSISVWGGEDNDPPTYGKMFLALKPINGERFGIAQKQQILTKVLRPKSLPNVAYEFVDPDYIYVSIDTEVRYSPALTGKSTTELSDLIKQNITNYAQTNLGQFGSVFRYSQISKVIDTTEQSIQSNITTVRMEKRITIAPSTGSYVMDYANPIFPSTSVNNLAVVTTRVGTQRFSHLDRGNVLRPDCYLENSAETLQIYRDDPAEGRVLVRANVGTVDFTTGRVTLHGFYPKNITTNFINELVIRVIPSVSDLIPRRAQIILVPPTFVTVRVVADLLDRSTSSTGRIVNGGIVF